MAVGQLQEVMLWGCFSPCCQQQGWRAFPAPAVSVSLQVSCHLRVSLKVTLMSLWPGHRARSLAWLMAAKVKR